MRTIRQAVVQTAVVAAAAFGFQQAQAACTFGGSGEPSLQASFNTLLGAGAPNVTTDCVADGADGKWSTVGSVAGVDIVLELAGNRDTNSFGLYDLNDPSRRLSIFEGNDGVDSQATLQLRLMGNGTWRASVLEINNPGDSTNWQHLNNLASSAFGFYLSTTTQGTFFSQTARNDDGVDHLYAYRGTQTPFLTGPLADEIFTLNDYLLAWEDLRNGGDLDFQDFVVAVKDIQPVPLPAALWLFASGLIGLAGVARRRA